MYIVEAGRRGSHAYMAVYKNKKQTAYSAPFFALLSLNEYLRCAVHPQPCPWHVCIL
jgi:hypothetical protein